MDRTSFEREYVEYNGRPVFQVFNENYTGQMLLAWIVNYMMTNEINAKEVIEILQKHKDNLEFDKQLETLYEGDDNQDNWCDGDTT